jgi:cytochrome c oxidase cbb3-type subunit 3
MSTNSHTPQRSPHADNADWQSAKDPVTNADLLDHEYDGIREYDNPTPGWWHAIFLASVMFAILYFAFFHLSPVSWSIQDRWQAQKVAETKKIFGKIGDLAADEPTIIKMSNDAPMMEVAKGMFVGNCASCHANDGGGINGVNLTDDHYKKVKKLIDVYTVITDGANNGAMPPWNARLSQNERVLLAAYVMNLRGTKPAAPRAPEGEVLPPFGPQVSKK